jgi:putative molybdopterin biosynthesis protein
MIMPYNVMIMTTQEPVRNRVREFRVNCGLTQAQLAEQAGISRTAVTAIEGDRLVPSVSAALALARALGVRVETLFAPVEASADPKWACQPTSAAGQFWEADVGARRWRYPAETTPMFTPLPDGRASDAEPDSRLPSSLAAQTLVIAGCDPAAGLLASAYTQASGKRLLVLNRSSRQALALLQQGKVHLAGVHFSTTEETEGNAEVVRQILGSDYQLLRVAEWQEGVTATPGARIRSVRGALRSKLRWVGREPGSGARLCLDRLLAGRPQPRRLARNHRGVAEAVHSGWADAGVCVQLTSAEAGLLFFPVQQEAYDLCLPNALLDDPRVQSLLQVMRSPLYRQTLAGLPGYSATQTGMLRSVL